MKDTVGRQEATTTNEKRRPYLSDRRCGRCLVPLEISERREDGWLFVVYRCSGCGATSTVTFSPQELQEWARRQGARAVGGRA